MFICNVFLTFVFKRVINGIYEKLLCINQNVHHHVCLIDTTIKASYIICSYVNILANNVQDIK